MALNSKLPFLKCFLKTNYRILTNTSRTVISSRPSENENERKYDLVIVGGGIVGTASAREIILENPNLNIAIVEKEYDIGLHQTLNNSGVIHAGIYYKPGSLKAKLCGEGLQLMYKYCDEKKIPYKKIGKLIVATSCEELPILDDLVKRACANKVPDIRILNADEIKLIEPHCTGLKALYSPHTGIINYKKVAESYLEDFKNCGGKIHTKFKVNQICEGYDPNYPVVVKASNKNYVEAKYVLTCAGLYSDKLAAMSQCSRDPQIIPFRGEYLMLKEEKRYLVNGNIYPVPDPRFPFLGVHFTPKINGDVILGPNAVIAFKREGYKWSDINLKELFETITYPGFLKMASKYASFGMQEMAKSCIKSLQVKHLKKYIPELTVKDVYRDGTGVRAQAMSLQGELVEDFVFSKGTKSSIAQRVLHCRNAPSPGATSSLAIAKHVASTVNKEFHLG